MPQHDDRARFELIILEGAQSGLSWSTLLAKRENYRRALDHFDAARIARYETEFGLRTTPDLSLRAFDE